MVSVPIYLCTYIRLCVLQLGVLLLCVASYQILVGSLDPEENHYQTCWEQLPEEQNDPEHDVSVTADLMHVPLQHTQGRRNTQKLTNKQVAIVSNSEELISLTNTEQLVHSSNILFSPAGGAGAHQTSKPLQLTTEGAMASYFQ